MPAILGFLGLEHDRAGAVAEQDAGRPVFPVEDAAERLRADHQSVIGHAALHHVVGNRQRVEEAGAHRLDVEGDAIVNARARSGPASALAGKVWSGVAVASTIRPILPASTPAAASALLAASVASVAVVSPSPAMWRASMPVRSTIHSSVRIDPLGELGIGDAARRQRGTGADDDRTAAHCAASWARRADTLARSSVILRVRSSRTIRAATRTALATPLSLALPWLFTTMPLRPRKTAPL